MFADPDPGTGASFTPDPDPGWEKNKDLDPGSGSETNIWEYIFESLESIFGLQILKLFDAELDPRSVIFLTLDPGSEMEKFGSRIRDPR